VLTRTSLEPEPAGTTTLRASGERYVTDVANATPKPTVAERLNPVPATVTIVPPRAAPAGGVTEVTAGFGTGLSPEQANISVRPTLGGGMGKTGLVTVVAALPGAWQFGAEAWTS
jgi:hypothetical protein